MIKKLVAIFVCMLVALGSVFTVAASTSVEKQKAVPQTIGNQKATTTLITELNNNRVIEVNLAGTIIWSNLGVIMPIDSERLANGNTLIAELMNNRVIEVNSVGNIVWQYTGGLYGPWDVERLANGNTLITDTYNMRVVEVDSYGTVVWSYLASGMTTDAERLKNGNTLITEFYYTNRVIEVAPNGTIVWQQNVLGMPSDVERLPNGNTLICEWYPNRVTEINNAGTIVWNYVSTVGVPMDAERFANGNTLISEIFYGDRVIEINSAGTIVWQKTGLITPTDAERISTPPGAPTITGKTPGKTGVEYEYTFNATDPDGDDVRYIIYWGDNTSNTTGYNPSGADVKVKHTWSNDGTYNVTAIAQDVYGFESPEGKLVVTMPRNKPSNFNLFNWLLERFSNAFPILRRLSGL
jgi:hypothetical protein